MEFGFCRNGALEVRYLAEADNGGCYGWKGPWPTYQTTLQLFGVELRYTEPSAVTLQH